jgi:transmembrane sensor
MNTQIYEQATDWLIKHREGGLDPRDKSRFDIWLRESPRHVQAYLEMSALWEDIPGLDASDNPTSAELIARARTEDNVYPLARSDVSAPNVRRSREPVGQVPRRRGLNAFSGLAAAMLLVVVAGATWYGLNRNTYATEIGEQRSIVLADGSTVELNARSRVRIRYTDQRRDVDLLEGQALFRVAHNKLRPFVVHSGTANVRAVGTQFDVYKKKGITVVTVVDGKVEVLSNETGSTAAAVPAGPAAAMGAGRSSIILVAGEQLAIAGSTSQTASPIASERPHRANVAGAIAWTERTLVFESAPLSEVVEEFNRYNKRSLVITDSQLESMRISGRFSSADPSLFLKFLHAQPELDIEERQTEVLIGKR